MHILANLGKSIAKDGSIVCIMHSGKFYISILVNKTKKDWLEHNLNFYGILNL